MGGGRFNSAVYSKTAASYANQDKSTLFKQRSIFPDFDPLKIKMRESCASREHPDPTSILIACDVTGSMGQIPVNLLKGGLGKIMDSLLKIQAISNPQVMFAAVGDTEHDKAPLQVTQFESDNRIEAQLKNLYLEGNGGPNDTESYQVIWYFAAYKTHLDCVKKGKKGILFTIGDELMPTVLTAAHIKKFIDKDYQGPDIPTSKLYKDASEKYEVFHLIVQDSGTYNRLGAKRMQECWHGYLGQRVIMVPKYTEIPEKIVATIKSLCELSAQEKALQIERQKQDDANQKAVENMADKLSKVGIFNENLSLPKVSAAPVLNKDSDGIPHLFLCSISLKVMDDPVTANDGYNYEKAEILKWFAQKAANPTSPKTGLAIKTDLIPNHDLRGEIIRWKESQKAAAAPSPMK